MRLQIFSFFPEKNLAAQSYDKKPEENFMRIKMEEKFELRIHLELFFLEVVESHENHQWNID